jgi:hypothetical protein
VRGIPVLIESLERAARQPVAERALLEGRLEPGALRPITTAPAPLEKALPFRCASSHVPFDRP